MGDAQDTLISIMLSGVDAWPAGYPSDHIRASLCEVLADRGRIDEARTVLTDIVDAQDAVFAAFGAAMRAFTRGRPDDATAFAAFARERIPAARKAGFVERGFNIPLAVRLELADALTYQAARENAGFAAAMERAHAQRDVAGESEVGECERACSSSARPSWRGISRRCSPSAGSEA
ncbi:MAG: hypothetical protein JW818_17890 [Pirellulales bacterium]|nr:hypothetical protein [Pirellulales bacterium]